MCTSSGQKQLESASRCNSLRRTVQLRDEAAYLTKVNHGTETDTGILLSRIYSHYGLVLLGSGPK